MNTLVARLGIGGGYVYQKGSDGSDTLAATTGSLGNGWVFQLGGGGDDTLSAQGLDGNDYIYQEGGTGNDTLRVATREGNDTTIIDAGPGDDTVIYDVDLGTDNASIDGGTGTDKLTVNNLFSQPVVIQDINSNTIYQSGVGGTTITVTSIEQITVNDAGGNPIFTWP